jgi:hypothetical protein
MSAAISLEKDSVIKRRWIKYILVNTITSPLKLVSSLLAVIYLIHIRAMNRAKGLHTRIEWHEKARKIK